MKARERARRILNHLEADGPAIDLGSTRMTGTSGWTYRALKRALDVLGTGGGYVVNPIHNILPEVPVENIVALYRTAQAYRYGGREKA